ncbi:thioredoxin-disulfide reductase [Allomyces macrogynus ATCC 38327]|uniref:Thioredoxin reductase n=1 Tax=Allomyces macrogynus (strain ATCC 38327) TaxID=578462 RepID=A0A0L0T2J3_ALLM3|nr:thioredoxin-disulfide reductase [Allomyces macrogynus ATCC 38327]|eukprot:KNE68875.1 thioredoxin-disulfide reductase [Allomyces macrogynus ATCC 38327]
MSTMPSAMARTLARQLARALAGAMRGAPAPAPLYSRAPRIANAAAPPSVSTLASPSLPSYSPSSLLPARRTLCTLFRPPSPRRALLARAFASSALLSLHATTPSSSSSPSASSTFAGIVSPNSSSSTSTTMSTVHKVIIVGSGPAAHTAAIYTGRANLNPVMYEGFMAGGIAAGGQLTTTTEIENFPGWPTGIQGSELMDRMRQQSEHCGATIITETIEKVDFSERPFKLWPEGASEPVLAESVIIATGATAKRMHMPGEDTYWNAGMSACAVCDGPAPIFRNKPLAVVGGGDSAVEEATHLTKYGSKVYLIVRRDKLRASKVMAHRAFTNPKIEILWNRIPVAAKGNGRLLETIVLKSTIPGEEDTEIDLPVNGFFYAIGHKPNVDWLKVADAQADGAKYQVETDQDGYVVVPPGTTQTSVEGVFACGDVADKKYRQAITAAGSGCAAALDCERWLEAQE